MNKVIMITGAASGIGRATAVRLLDSGYIVYGADIAFDRMEDLEARGMHRIRMDVTSDEQVKEGVARIINEQGRIDGLFANAGYTCLGMFELVSIDEARRQFDVNVFGVARCIKAVLPHMRSAVPEGRGHIVITSSGSGKVSAPGFAWYPASKHALEALGDGLRMEMKHCYPGIHVVLIEPGYIKSELYNSSIETWKRAMEQPEATAYAESMDRVRKNFTSGFNAGQDADTVARVVLRVFNSPNPSKRYATNKDSKAAVLAARLIGNSNLLDRQIIRVVLGGEG